MNVNDLLAKFQPVGLSRDSAESFQQLEDSITKLSERIDKITSIQVPKDRYDYNIIRDLNREYKTLKENAQSLKDGDFSKRGEIELSAQSIDSLTKNLAKVNRGKDITEIEAHLDGIKKPLSDFTASLKNAASSGLDATKQAVSQGAQAVGSAIQRSGLPEDAEKIGSATLGPYFELAREIKNTGVVRNLFQSAKGFVKTLSKRTYSDSVESVDSYLKDKGVDEQNRQKVIAELKTTINEGRLSDVYDVLNDINSKMEESGTSSDELVSRRESLTNFAQFAVAKGIIDSDDLSAKSVDVDPQLELPFPEFKDRTSKAKLQSSEDKAKPEYFTTGDYLSGEDEIKEDVNSIDETTKEILAILSGDKKKKKEGDSESSSGGLFGMIGSALEGIGDIVGSAFEGIGNMLGGVANALGLRNLFKNPFNRAKRGIPKTPFNPTKRGFRPSGGFWGRNIGRGLRGLTKGALVYAAGDMAYGLLEDALLPSESDANNSYEAQLAESQGFDIMASTGYRNEESTDWLTKSTPILNVGKNTTGSNIDLYGVAKVQGYREGGNRSYNAVNTYGFSGKYQMSLESLAQYGLINRASGGLNDPDPEEFTWEKYKRDHNGGVGSKEEHLKALRNDKYWTGKSISSYGKKYADEFKRAWKAVYGEDSEVPKTINYDVFLGEVEAQGRKKLGLEPHQGSLHQIIQESIHSQLKAQTLKDWNKKIKLSDIGLIDPSGEDKEYLFSELATRAGLTGEQYSFGYNMQPQAIDFFAKYLITQNLGEQYWMQGEKWDKLRDRYLKEGYDFYDGYVHLRDYIADPLLGAVTANRLISEGVNPESIGYLHNDNISEEWFKSMQIAYQEDKNKRNAQYDEYVSHLDGNHRGAYLGFDISYQTPEMREEVLNRIKKGVVGSYGNTMWAEFDSTSGTLSRYNSLGVPGGYGDPILNEDALKNAVESVNAQELLSLTEPYVGKHELDQNGKPTNQDFKKSVSWLLDPNNKEFIEGLPDGESKNKLINLRDASWRIAMSKGWVYSQNIQLPGQEVKTIDWSLNIPDYQEREEQEKPLVEAKKLDQNRIVAEIASEFATLPAASVAQSRIEQSVLPRVSKESFSKPVKASTLSQTPRVEPQVTTPKPPEFEKADPFKQQITPTNNVTTNNTSIYQVGANYKQANVGE